MEKVQEIGYKKIKKNDKGEYRTKCDDWSNIARVIVVLAKYDIDKCQYRIKADTHREVDGDIGYIVRDAIFLTTGPLDFKRSMLEFLAREKLYYLEIDEIYIHDTENKTYYKLEEFDNVFDEVDEMYKEAELDYSNFEDYDKYRNFDNNILFNLN